MLKSGLLEIKKPLLGVVYFLFYIALAAEDVAFDFLEGLILGAQLVIEDR